MSMNYYIVNVRGGHVGIGKYVPLKFYVKSNSMCEAIDYIKHRPGVKRGISKYLLSAEQISEEEYYEDRPKNDAYVMQRYKEAK